MFDDVLSSINTRLHSSALFSPLNYISSSVTSKTKFTIHCLCRTNFIQETEFSLHHWNARVVFRAKYFGHWLISDSSLCCAIVTVFLLNFFSFRSMPSNAIFCTIVWPEFDSCWEKSVEFLHHGFWNSFFIAFGQSGFVFSVFVSYYTPLFFLVKFELNAISITFCNRMKSVSCCRLLSVISGWVMWYRTEPTSSATCLTSYIF